VKEKVRPVAITIICIVAFAFVIIGFPSIFSPFIKKLGIGYPALFGTILAFNFISLVGVWHMKKWGAYIYLITAMINQSLLLLINRWVFTDIIVPLLFISTTYYYYKQMDNNL